jgi:hypothetical protein
MLVWSVSGTSVQRHQSAAQQRHEHAQEAWGQVLAAHAGDRTLGEGAHAEQNRSRKPPMRPRQGTAPAAGVARLAALAVCPTHKTTKLLGAP